MGNVLIKSFTNYLNINFQQEFKIDFKDCFYMYDPVSNKRDEFHSKGYRNYMNSEEEVIGNSKRNFICVKPDTVIEVLTKTKPQTKKDALQKVVKPAAPARMLCNCSSCWYW